MAEKQVGIAVLGWGTVDETWGYAENVNVADEAEKENVPNGDGDTVGVIYSDIRQKVTADFTPLATVPTDDPPKLELEDIIGEQLTIKTLDLQDLDIIVDGAEKKYQKGKIMTWSVNGYYYPDVTPIVP